MLRLKAASTHLAKVGFGQDAGLQREEEKNGCVESAEGVRATAVPRLQTHVHLFDLVRAIIPLVEVPLAWFHRLEGG